MKIPFPQIIDNSMYAAYKACPQKFFKTYLQHWKPKGESVHLVAGKAYAAGLEVARRSFFEEGKSEADSQALGLAALVASYGDFQCPTESAKSLGRTMGALEFYLSRYPLSSEEAKPLALPDGKKAIEMSFAEPLDVTHPDTGDPILYVGRADQLVEYAGANYGEDDKTTSSLGFSWGEKWHLTGQFTGYTWGFRKIGFDISGYLVRGTSILKTKYETQQIVTYRPQWMIDRWYEQLIEDLEHMIELWEEAVSLKDGEPFHYNLSDSCTTYGLCAFYNVCRSKEEAPWLRQDFERRAWDPVNRSETILPEPKRARVLFSFDVVLEEGVTLHQLHEVAARYPIEAIKDLSETPVEVEVKEIEVSTAAPPVQFEEPAGGALLVDKLVFTP